jgi:hypothetical protein
LNELSTRDTVGGDKRYLERSIFVKQAVIRVLPPFTYEETSLRK